MYNVKWQPVGQYLSNLATCKNEWICVKTAMDEWMDGWINSH